MSISELAERLKEISKENPLAELREGVGECAKAIADGKKERERREEIFRATVIDFSKGGKKA